MPIGPDTDQQGAARSDRSGEWVWDEASKSRTRMHTEAEMEEQRAKAEADPDHVPTMGVTDHGAPFMGGLTTEEAVAAGLLHDSSKKLNSDGGK